jgi:hypothetical protein
VRASRLPPLGLGLLVVLIVAVVAGCGAQKAPARLACLTADQGVRRVSVIGLPEALADRVIEHLTEGRRFQPVERKALQSALSEQRFGRPPRQTYLDQTLNKAIKDMDKVEGETVLVTLQRSAEGVDRSRDRRRGRLPGSGECGEARSDDFGDSLHDGPDRGPSNQPSAGAPASRRCESVDGRGRPERPG